MIRVRDVKTTFLVLAACLGFATSAVQAAMYKWADDNGTATFSDQAPAEPDKVRDLTVVEGIPAARTAPVQEPQHVEPEKKAVTSVTHTKPEQPSYTRAPAKFGESFRPDTPRTTESAAWPRQDNDAALRELSRVQARGRTEAVRDPCLLSSDRRCYERNKERYNPYFGYAPSMMQSAATAGTGATNPTAAGAVAGPAREAPVPVRHIEPAPPTTGVR